MTTRRGGRDDSAFAIISERHASHVLYLSGSLGAAEALELDAIGATALAASTCGLVLDVTELVGFGDAGVTSIKNLGNAARARRATITVRTPGAHLEAELTAAQFDQGVRVESTEPLATGRAPDAIRAVVAVAAKEPAQGTPRRTGRGFVASFGDGRTCRVAGCETRLSQYNALDVCGVHEQAHEGRR